MSPTHRCGHTLDVVMTFADCTLDNVGVDPTGVLSDHSLIVCRVPAAVDLESSTTRLVMA